MHVELTAGLGNVKEATVVCNGKWTLIEYNIYVDCIEAAVLVSVEILVGIPNEESLSCSTHF